MQNTIYLCFSYLLLLLSPLGLDANMDSKTIKTSALANAEMAKVYRHFPKANPFDRFRILKQTGPTLENRPNTEGSSDVGFWMSDVGKRAAKIRNRTSEIKNTEGSSGSENSVKKMRSKRFWRIFGAIVGGLALIYWLQGTIWLAVVTLAICLYFFNRKKIQAWDRDRYARSQSMDDASLDKDRNGNPIYPLSHAANKWTRLAINRFAIGTVLGGLGLLLVLLGAILAGSTSSIGGLLLLGLIALGVGYIFTIIGFLNACKAVANKEPKQLFAWLIILLSLPSIISLLGLLIGFA